jgi:hypothetical protein
VWLPGGLRLGTAESVEPIQRGQQQANARLDRLNAAAAAICR